MDEGVTLPERPFRGRVGVPLGDDARLLRRASKGDEAAFAAIFERHGQDLYRYCRAILSNPDDAQDALQNTMTRVLRALPGEERSLNLRPWLFRVARNEALNLIRERQATVELAEGMGPVEPAADIRAEQREAVRTLVSDLASLPETQRTALVLHELNGLSHMEISDAMQRSPRASRQTIYEARLALAELEEGRSMECDDVRLMISDGDGRVTRGRKVRSHLRSCEGCSDFALAIGDRREKLAALAPPLPASVGSVLFASAIGSAGATGAGAGATGVAASSMVLKAVAVVGASVVVGTGGAIVAGVDLPGALGGESDSHESQAGGSGSDGAQSGANAGDAADGAQGASADAGARGRDDGGQSGQGGPGAKPGAKNSNGSAPPDKQDADKGRPDEPASNGVANANPDSNAGGASSVAPAGSGKPETPPGQTTNQGQGNGPPADAGTPGSSGSAGPPAHSNAGGNSANGGKPEK